MRKPLNFKGNFGASTLGAYSGTSVVPHTRLITVKWCSVIPTHKQHRNGLDCVLDSRPMNSCFYSTRLFRALQICIWGRKLEQFLKVLGSKLRRLMMSKIPVKLY